MKGRVNFRELLYVFHQIWGCRYGDSWEMVEASVSRGLCLQSWEISCPSQEDTEAGEEKVFPDPLWVPDWV